jgi:hypothetical protein
MMPQANQTHKIQIFLNHHMASLNTIDHAGKASQVVHSASPHRMRVCPGDVADMGKISFFGVNIPCKGIWLHQA